ncbi:F-box protein CPR1-like protein [Tanacetum coccineum]
MAELVPDVLEKILITLDVKDLSRCKSVCKFWHSLISSSRFVTAHMNHGYNNDRMYYESGHRRILMSCPGLEYNCYILGSANGLVCIKAGVEIFVANPSTREVKNIQKRSRVYNTLKISAYSCWGFGYDSSADDYKVVVGSMIDNNPICFQVLALKSNAWKDVGKLDHELFSSIGTLCNGALHWFMKDRNDKKVIISFNLITEEITEIPLPNDPSYKATKFSRLGIIDECLCIYYILDLHSPIWVMKNYNVPHSWTAFPSRHARKHNDVEHYLKNLKNYVPNTSIFDENIKYRQDLDSIGSPVFVQSLVSPHFTGRQKRKNDAHNS